MKWLVDAQLPPRLCTWLRERGEKSIHVSELENGLRLSDENVWQYAKREHLIILTKDRDFFERSLVFGSPPQVIHVIVGNCSNERLFQILDSLWKDVKHAVDQKRPLIAVTKNRVERF